MAHIVDVIPLLAPKALGDVFRLLGLWFPPGTVQWKMLFLRECVLQIEQLLAHHLCFPLERRVLELSKGFALVAEKHVRTIAANHLLCGVYFDFVRVRSQMERGGKSPDMGAPNSCRLIRRNKLKTRNGSLVCQKGISNQITRQFVCVLLLTRSSHEVKSSVCGGVKQ